MNHPTTVNTSYRNSAYIVLHVQVHRDVLLHVNRPSY